MSTLMIVRVMKTSGLMLVAVLLLTVVAGCEKAQSQTTPAANGPPKMPPAEVFVAKPEIMQLNDFADYQGRLKAKESVTVQAHVTGFLKKISFADGALVKKDQVLFEIDPRTYRADLDSKEALLMQAQRRGERLKFELDRVQSLIDSKTISQETFDQRKFDYLEGLAAIQSLKANRDAASEMLGYTEVGAPISGRASNRRVDEGNLVKADETVLTTIVSQDPIYAEFDIEEQTLIKMRRLAEEGKLPADGKISGVQLAVSDEKTFTGKRMGDINFIDNAVDPQTGTVRYRATFPNPTGILSPGMYVRVRVPLGEPHPSVVIPEKALGSDQNRKFVFVVDQNNKAIYRQVEVGIAVDSGKRVIDKGLNADEMFITDGLQRVKSGSDVNPKPAATNGKPLAGVSSSTTPIAESPSEKAAAKYFLKTEPASPADKPSEMPSRPKN